MFTDLLTKWTIVDNCNYCLIIKLDVLKEMKIIMMMFRLKNIWIENI